MGGRGLLVGDVGGPYGSCLPSPCYRSIHGVVVVGGGQAARLALEHELVRSVAHVLDVVLLDPPIAVGTCRREGGRGGGEANCACQCANYYCQFTN